MLFYNLNLTTFDPRKIVLPYRHLLIVNRSVNTININFNNNSPFCEVQSLDSFTFLDVINVNAREINKSSAIRTLELLVVATVVPSIIHIYNYGEK